MELYRLKPYKTRIGTAKVFYGIDKRPDAPEFSLRSSMGLTPKEFPHLSSGPSLKKERAFSGRVLSVGGSFGLIENGKFYLGDKETALKVSESTTSVLKMGKALVAFPDKTCLEDGVSGYLEAEFKTNATGNSRPYFTLVSSSGENYQKNPIVGPDMPANPENGDLWIDTSSGENILKSFSNGVYFEVYSPSVKISYKGIGTLFKKGEGVKIENTSLDGDYVLKEVGNDYIIIGALLSSPQYSNITIKREVPDLSFATVFGNRIFGCHSSGGAIYASALGQMKNWNAFEGIASDSYFADVLDGEEFTAVCPFLGSLYFFKENCIYQLRGNSPENFQLVKKDAPGVKKGSEKSIFQSGGAIYYNSPEGFMCFDGSFPERVFKGIGDLFGNVFSAENGKEVYFADEKGLYALNTENGVIVTVKEGKFTDLVFKREALFLVSEGNLYSLTASPADFSAEFNPLGERKTGNEYLSRIDLSFTLSGSLSLYVSYDGGDYIPIFSLEGERQGETKVPLILNRHVSLKLKFKGRGEFALKALTLTYREV